MKYALLVFHPKEQFDRPRDSAMIAAGKAYGEALRAAGVVVTAAGLQPPHSATMVSVRDGKRPSWRAIPRQRVEQGAVRISVRRSIQPQPRPRHRARIP